MLANIMTLHCGNIEGIRSTYNLDPPRHPLLDSCLGLIDKSKLW